MKAEKMKKRLLTVVGTILSLIVLFPFFLVVINSAKQSADIVISPIALPDNWGQMLENMKNVMNNQNFSYWSSFGSSLLITVRSEERR